MSKLGFLAIYLISQAKTGLSSLALKRQLGVSYPTTWLMHQKINRAMACQDATHRLSGLVQLDDAYLGGERTGGKAGRGCENKVPFVAAVSVTQQGQPMYLKLNLVDGFTLNAIGNWAKANLAPGTVVTSDGLGCFAAVVDAGCMQAEVAAGGPALRDRFAPHFAALRSFRVSVSRIRARPARSACQCEQADAWRLPVRSVTAGAWRPVLRLALIQRPTPAPKRSVG